MKHTTLIINGVAGRMGRELAEVNEKEKCFSKCYGIDHKGRGDAKSLKSIKNLKTFVLIDFTSPKGFSESLKFCIVKKQAFVSGTTGLEKKHQAMLRAAAKKIPVLWAPNMSVGINLFLRLIRSLGPTLKNYDLQLEEFHHRHKKDAPSGTALLLQKELETQLENKAAPVLVGRGGGIVGMHKLWLCGAEEVVTIEHTAISRTVFAKGAMQAAVWLKDQKPGFYTMDDLLNDQ